MKIDEVSFIQDLFSLLDDMVPLLDDNTPPEPESPEAQKLWLREWTRFSPRWTPEEKEAYFIERETSTGLEKR